MSEKNERREPDSTDPAQLGMFSEGRKERVVWVETPHDDGDGADLWIPDYLPRARRTDPETSHQAAESMVGGAASQRAEILRVMVNDAGGFSSRGWGWTADELDQWIGWRATTAGRRLIELQRLGLVRRTTEKRKTRSGRAAFVWVAV